MKIRALEMLRGSRVVLDKGQVADLEPDLATSLLDAGVVESVFVRELAQVPPAERAVVPEAPAAEAKTPEPKKALAAWPPNKRIKKSPSEYLKAAPNGKYAELARQHVGE